MSSDRTFNISSLLSQAARSWPDRPAAVAPHRPDVLGRTQLTYKELDDSSSLMAAHLVRGDVPPGSRIIVMVRPGLDFMIIIFGLFKAGLAPVMVDPGMGVKRMLRCLAEGRPSGIVGLPVAHLLSLTAPGYFRGLKVRVTVGRRWGWGGRTFEEIMKAEAPADEPELPVPTRGGDLAALLFTSGSTGPAKGVVYTHDMFEAQVESIREGFDIRPGGIDLATFPLFGLFAPAQGFPFRPRAQPVAAVPQKSDFGRGSGFAPGGRFFRFAHERRSPASDPLRGHRGGAAVDHRGR